MTAGRLDIRTGVLVHAGAAAILVVIGVAALVSDVASADLVRDPTAVLDGPFHAGVLSSLGILGWTTAAAISGFGAALVHDRRLRQYLIATSALTTVLALDDLLLIHDEIAPDHLGIPENAVLGVLALAAAAYAITFRAELTAIDDLTFLVAASLTWFGASVFLDVVADDWFGRHHFLVEDGCKFVGIVTWAAFVALKTLHLVRPASELTRSATAPR